MKKVTTFLSPIRLLILLSFVSGVMNNFVNAQVNPVCVSATAAMPGFATDFDSLAGTGTSSKVPAGFGFVEAGTNANSTYNAGTGSSSTGDTYSFGASGDADRALGSLQSGSLMTTVGACIANNTGAEINSITVSYDGEQWRLGAAGREDRLDFQYSLDATSLADGVWTDFDALDLVSPTTAGTTGALDGNAVANRTAGVTSSISGLSIPVGATLYIRFTDFNASGSDDALAIDNFSIVAFPNLAASARVSGRVLDETGRGIGNVRVQISGGQLTGSVYTYTSPFGYYDLEVPAGQTYLVSVGSKRYSFINPAQVVDVGKDVTDLIFVAVAR